MNEDITKSEVESVVEEVVDKMESDPEDLPERTEDEEIEIEQETVTDDIHQFPCYKIRRGDSWMSLVHDTSEDRLYISHVWMEYQGDFSTLMDALVEELGTNKIKFTMVINDNLQEVLNGFEEKEEYYEAFDEYGKVLVGEWN